MQDQNNVSRPITKNSAPLRSNTIRTKVIGTAVLSAALFTTAARADVNGSISDMHYSIWDADQSSAICFEVGGVALAFLSNGSEKDRVISALIVSAFTTGKTLNVSTSPSPLSPAPCQSWEFPTIVYQVYAIAFAP